MNIGKSAVSLMFALLLAAGVSGCATFSKCGLNGCPGDAEITAAVQAQLAQHPALQLRDIGVQTLDQIVYLHGVVDTELERNVAESSARKTTGVVKVVSSISVRNSSDH